MPLPPAVQRNADKARALVAGSRGESPQPTPRQADSEYLNVESVAQSPTQETTTTVSPVSAKALADQQAKLDSERHVAQRTAESTDDGGYIPHALSKEVTANGANVESSAAPVANDTLSNTDTVNVDQANALPEFIGLDDWKNRYAALRISRDERNAQLEQELQTLRTQNAQLQQAAPTVEKVPVAKQFELDEATRASIGEEQSQVFDKLSQSVEERFAQADQVAQADKRKVAESFETNLGSMVPRWREINVDPKFLEWLAIEDPALGMRRHAMLDAFVREFDAPSVAQLFRSYAASGHAPDPQRVGHDNSPELQNNRAGTGLGAEESMVEVWDQSEIAEFYHSKNRLYQSGKLKGAMLEKVMADEARIRKAMDEGRVNNNA